MTARAWALAVALLLPATAFGGDREFGEYLSLACTTCHQTSGAQVAGVPAITGMPQDQFVALMLSYKDNVRDNQVMRTIASGLSRDEIEALAAFYESLGRR